MRTLRSSSATYREFDTNLGYMRPCISVTNDRVPTTQGACEMLLYVFFDFEI